MNYELVLQFPRLNRFGVGPRLFSVRGMSVGTGESAERRPKLIAFDLGEKGVL